MNNVLKYAISFLILGVVIYYAISEGNYQDEQLKKYPKETIGTVYKYGTNAKGTPMVWYEYEVNGIKLTSWSGMKNFGDSRYDSSHVGERYMVVYSTNDAKVSRIDFNSPVKNE